MDIIDKYNKNELLQEMEVLKEKETQLKNELVDTKIKLTISDKYIDLFENDYIDLIREDVTLNNIIVNIDTMTLKEESLILNGINEIFEKIELNNEFGNKKFRFQKETREIIKQHFFNSILIYVNNLFGTNYWSFVIVKKQKMNPICEMFNELQNKNSVLPIFSDGNEIKPHLGHDDVITNEQKIEIEKLLKKQKNNK